MINKTTTVFFVALVAAFATPALAQSRHVQQAPVYEGRNAGIAPDAGLSYSGREALVHAN